MFAAAFSAIASGFAAQLGGPFIEVTAKWLGTPTMDSGGSITSPGVPTLATYKAQFDAPTTQMRADPTFLEKDVRLIVLAADADQPLDMGAKVIVEAGENAGTWSLESCQGDPIGIGWECRARRVA